MSDYLPPEIISKILQKVPAKTLGICACVSKPWNSMIKNPDFLSENLNHSFFSPSHPHLCLLRVVDSNGQERYSLHFDDQAFTFYKLVVPPHKRTPRCYKIIGSCNGIICLADDFVAENETYRLWNPLIRRFETVSPPLTTRQEDPLVGFGFDSQRKDFKLLKIVQPNVEVYSQKSSVWKNVSIAVPCDEVLWQERTTFFNGCVHFIGLRSGRNEIVRFHMEEENFSTSIELPQVLATNMEDTMTTFAYRNSSVGVFFDQSVEPVGFHVWVMNDYAIADSWTRLVVINEHPRARPVGFRNNGDIMLQNSDGQILLLELETRTVRHLGIFGVYPFAFVSNYVESLALLHLNRKKRSREN